MTEQATLSFLRVWSDLEACYYGQNGYGGDVAEIYAYRLLMTHPMKDPHEDALVAGRELSRILNLFLAVHDDAEAWIEDFHEARKFIPLARSPHVMVPAFGHRIHIRITRSS